MLSVSNHCVARECDFEIALGMTAQTPRRSRQAQPTAAPSKSNQGLPLPPIGGVVNRTNLSTIAELIPAQPTHKLGGKPVKGTKARKEKLSIYLARNGGSSDADLIHTEGAKEPFALEVPGCKALLYIKLEKTGGAPSWTKLFTSGGGVPEEAFGRSRTVGAVLVVRRNDRSYLLSFGSGFHLLKDGALERDFGLRVALNSVEPTKLRSLDKASYDHNPLNSRTQSTTNVDIFDLDMDSELELLYALTGTSRVPAFGGLVTGRDALTIAVETDLRSIPQILDEAIRRYEEKLPPEFEWVDNVRRVKGEEDRELLDALLDDALIDPSKAHALWLGEPEVVDWEAQVGYSFDGYVSTARHPVLHLDHLREYLEGKGLSLGLETLKATSVHINDAEWCSIKLWPAYRCIYAEIQSGPDTYMLRNGVWYRVVSSFVELVDASLRSLEPYAFTFPTYCHEREEDYNEAVAKDDQAFWLMDQKNTRIGGPYDKVEFCDLIRNADLIHVKYYRNSGTLSHLFAQGFVAAEAFIKDEEFRRRLNEKLPLHIRLKDPSTRPDAETYCVVYAVATTKLLPKELPFFSKVTLRNALRTLDALGYKVRLSAIDVAPELFVKKKLNEKARARRKVSNPSPASAPVGLDMSG